MLEHHRRAPGRPNRPEVRRGRLLRAVYERWNHRVTVIVGGAGFGKTTLLAQAVDENLLAPRGDDLWLGCRPGNAELLTLAQALAAVFEVELPVTSGPAATDERALAAVLANAMWQRAPRHACLFLDDVHHVVHGSPAARLLTALIEVLPANGHVVLASRQEPPVELARLDVQGQILCIDEKDLAFDSTELTSFASLRGISTDQLDGIGGWPALAELRALGHPGQVDDFLVEAVLRGLTRDQRRALAVAAAIGGCDRELFAIVTGYDVDLAGLFDDIPLVSCDEDGWFTIHPVWSTQLADQIEPDERAVIRRKAGKALLPRDFHTAMDLLLTAGKEADIEDALRRSCHAHRLPTSIEGLHHLYDSLSPQVRERGIGQLLAGMTTAAHDLTAGIAHIERALHRCRREGDEIGMLLALEHLSIYLHWLEEPKRLQSLWQHVVEGAFLADTARLTVLARALIADTSGDAHGVLRALRPLEGVQVPSYWTVSIAWLRATALLALGFPEAAKHHIELAVDGTGALLRGAMSMRLVDVLFLTRDHERAFHTLDRMIKHRAETGNAQTCCLGHCQAATLHALVGRVDLARSHVHRATLYAGPEPNPPAAAAVLAAKAVVAVADGDEEEAARLLPEHCQGRAIGEGRQRYGQLRRLPLHYVLEPSTRSYWDALDVGPCYVLARDLAQAMTALRDDSDITLAARLSPEHWATAPAFLPQSWQVELAVAAAAGGSAEGQRHATALSAAARPALRRMAESRRAPGDLRRWVLTMLDVPTVPRSRLRIHVLGRARLQRDGQAVDHPHWRRQRVRALLLYLVARQVGTREEVATALWPDLDERSAAHNLRVNLSYLLAVLEPDRPDGDPSCFVHTETTSIHLVTHDWLTVDAWEMERLIDRARDAERGGEPSVALGHLREAVDLYRGPYLADAGYEAWALPHRDRLTARFVAAAVHAGELTLAAGNVDEGLRLASRALEEEPYSEPAHRLAIAAHLARGDVAAAHRARATCRRQLDELGVGPSEDLQMLERSLNAAPHSASSALLT